MKRSIRTSLGLVLIVAAVSATASVKDAERKGDREGREYRRDLISRGITPDGTACAVGMAERDRSNPQYSQL